MTVPFAELVSLAGAMVVQARGASRPADGETAATVAALLVAEPRNEAQVLAIVTVIVRDALADPFRETTANRWRTLLPAWVQPQLVGSTVNRLRAAGLLVSTGRYVRSTDSAGRNIGKLQPVYAFDAAALDGHHATEQAAAS
ncbi:hypothetical protein [Amycolatopsis sp. PS_44_ISF1]|uniref:hypothetical protein n=1 Tax=Amycolatopsis sp. PS_44_ISF1 TaxID=2974917 RepID=UPI0028DF74C3|nr:hypothetical protein [Amycolatopsis sp. PS_44_ISF1]MDT8910915.1 hypothetical protein [Amycolatopsis sp. PS_44_ISF1]MDT8916313.1 hypothetical protein [Amycolatopsis sp. PS_44_ISF1]